MKWPLIVELLFLVASLIIERAHLEWSKINRYSGSTKNCDACHGNSKILSLD